MAQLIATNQLTLTNVIDGKTSYHHWAYSDNADGTGLTLTDNGQRYMGYYTDYTQDDSTDKTKYRWADRWAKIEVGGENLVEDVAHAATPVKRTNSSSLARAAPQAMASSAFSTPWAMESARPATYRLAPAFRATISRAGP